MYEAIIFLTDGFEEIEALTVVDVLRRGGCETVLVSLANGAQVTGSHGITVQADLTFADLSGGVEAGTVLILPGGPGTSHYKDHEQLLALLRAHHGNGGRIAAICAAPSVLAMLGLLNGRTAVCYPSFEPELAAAGAVIGAKPVEQDGPFITSRGPATALSFALAVLGAIKGEETANKVSGLMLYA